MPAAALAAAVNPADPQTFHASLVADLDPHTPLEQVFADQAARAAVALQQLAATADPARTFTAEQRLSTLLSRALRELRLLQSDRRKRDQDTQSSPTADAAPAAPAHAAPAAPRPPSPGRAHTPASPNTATRLGKGGGEGQITTAADSAITPLKPALLGPPDDITRPFNDILASAPSTAATALLQRRRRKR